MQLPLKIIVAHKEVKIFNEVRSAFMGERVVVHYTSSGLEALMAFRVAKVDLLVCGEDLLVISGTEVIRSIRKNYPNINTLFILESDCDKEGSLSIELSKALEHFTLAHH